MNPLIVAFVCMLGFIFGSLIWTRIVLVALAWTGIKKSGRHKSVSTPDEERKALRIIFIGYLIWAAVFGVVLVLLWNRVPDWVPWLFGSMMLAPIATISFQLFLVRRARLRKADRASL